MSNETKNYTKAGELHFRTAAKTGDKYLSGTLKLNVNDHPIELAFTIFGNKAKLEFQPQSPDAFIFIENDDITLPVQIQDDIPF